MVVSATALLQRGRAALIMPGSGVRVSPQLLDKAL
jgi:hypothetical protein